MNPDDNAREGDDPRGHDAPASFADADLRAALAAVDPARGGSPDRAPSETDTLAHAWARIQAEVVRADPQVEPTTAQTTDPAAASPIDPAAASPTAPADPVINPVHPAAKTVHDSVAQSASPGAPKRQSWWALAAAACLGAALVGGSVAATQTFSGGGADSGTVVSSGNDGAASSTEPFAGAAVEGSASDSSSRPDSQPGAEPSTIARSASGAVATEDPRAARDSYVATITGLGGRVTSETISTTGAGGGVEPMPADVAIYPPIYGGSGIFLDLEVPAAQYDQAVAAIAPLGEVIEFSQTAYETGTSIAEGEARIAVLQQSLTRLQALLSQANGVVEVIELENAITSRQSELDALTAQQRYLTDQVEQSRISLRLVTPEDAKYLSGDPDTWWERFTAGLSAAWEWLGRALAWSSPLWIAGLLWWFLHRRRTSQTPDSDAPNRRPAAG